VRLCEWSHGSTWTNPRIRPVADGIWQPRERWRTTGYFSCLMWMALKKQQKSSNLACRSQGFQMHACAPTPAMMSTWHDLLLSPPPLMTRCVLHVQPSLSSLPFITQCILPACADTSVFPWFYNHLKVKPKFILFIPRHVHKQFTTLNQYTILFLRYLYYVTLNIATCFGPRVFFIREPNQSNNA